MLREWVDLPEDPHEVAERLTSIGFEVESIAPVAGEFTEVVVAQIRRSPRTRRPRNWQICQVSDGSGASLQIVCGASNARQGLKSALARIGAELPGGVQIKRAKLRGWTRPACCARRVNWVCPNRTKAFWSCPRCAAGRLASQLHGTR